MLRRLSIVAFVSAVALLVSTLLLVGADYSYASTPSAGSCSEETGDWICNVQDQDLSFDEVGSTTQTGSGSDDFDAVNGGEIVYKNVFIDGSVAINARLSVTEKTSGITIDADESADPLGIWTYVGRSVSSDTNTEFTVEFFEADSGKAVRLLNVEILVKDIDGYAQEEFAAFRGLNSYVVTTNTVLDVATEAAAGDPSSTTDPGLENPTPETGIRQFLNEDTTTAAGGMAVTDEEAWVGVKFDSVLSIGFQAGNRDTSSGSVGFIFTNIESAFTTPTQQISVADASYTVTYDNNSGDVAAPAAETFTGAGNLNTGTGMSKSGVNISSWNTKADGTGASYSLGSSYTAVQDVTLFAIYAAKTVTFNANGGTGSDYTQTSSGPTALTANSFIRTGYSFSGWNTATDGSGASFANSASFPFSTDDTLYAQWTLIVATADSTRETEESCQSGIFLTVRGGNGSGIKDSPVTYGACNLNPRTPYSLRIDHHMGTSGIHSVLALGTIPNSGAFDNTVDLPWLTAGNYKITLTSTHPDGSLLKLTNYITVNAAYTYLSVSGERLQPHLQ